jgi:hypothetical protein
VKHDFSKERRASRHSSHMMSTLRASWKPALCGGAVALALGVALGGCRVDTQLADATHDGAGGDDGTSSQATGGTPSLAGGGTDAAGTGGASMEVGGTGGTSAESGGAGGTGGAAPSGGGSGACWETTVQNFCDHFDCPPSAQPPSLPTEEEVRQHYMDSGLCDEVTLMRDRDTCGGAMIGYDDGSAAESYLIISGTLGAAAISRDAPFGPCNQTSYWAGIEADEWYAMCEVESRCVLCGPPLPDDPQYPSCRNDCQCELVAESPDPCFDPDSCECYCSRVTPG